MARVLRVELPKRKAHAWADGLMALKGMVAQPVSPAHSRWALACMAATSNWGASGYLRRADLWSLMVRANARFQLSKDQLAEAFVAVEASEQQLQTPPWLRLPPTSDGRPPHQLNARHITLLLLELMASSTTISELFDAGAASGFWDSDEWLRFVQAEQLPNADESCEADGATVHTRVAIEEDVQAAPAQQHDEGSSRGEPRSAKRLNRIQFALELLSPQNDAVARNQGPAAIDDAHKPLAHYWTACSHNSCAAVALELMLPALCTLHRVTSLLTAADLVGDQLTGLSSADTCKSCNSIFLP